MQQMTPELVGDLCGAVRSAALETHEVDSCIYTASILARVIELGGAYFDAESVPVVTVLPVYVLALNPVLRGWFEGHGRLPKDAAEIEEARAAGGWMVSIAPKPGEVYGEGSDRFPGHLALGLDFGATGRGMWLADPSIDQASRPKYRLNLSPMILPLELPAGQIISADWSGGRFEVGESLLLYERVEVAPERWEGSPDWARGQLWSGF